jgi:hypothetical protein
MSWLGRLAILVVVALLGVAIVIVAGRRNGETFPSRPADYLSDFCSGNLPRSIEPDQFRLTGPHFDLAFSGSRVMTLDNELNKPAGGHEFLCLEVGDQKLASYPVESDDKVQARVVVDGVSRLLPDLPATGLEMSVPVGHPAILQVTDDGRTQSMDLRTGQRGDDAIAGYYHPHDLIIKPATYDAKGRASYLGAGLDVETDLTLEELRGSVQPWIPGRGWAPHGKAWLELSGPHLRSWTTLSEKVTASNIWALLTAYWIDENRSFALTSGTGKSIRPMKMPTPRVNDFFPIGIDVNFVFLVPDSFAAGDLYFRPVGQFYPGGTKKWRPGAPGVPFVWSRRLAARHTALKLG